MARRHGFVCPWGPHQVLALLLYVYLLLAFYILTAPFLPSSASHITFQVLYGVVAAATLVVGVMATSADPSDPALKDPSVGAQSTGYRCSICEVYVRPRSKHCRVDRFTGSYVYAATAVYRQRPLCAATAVCSLEQVVFFHSHCT
ncbi:hypothetical protein WJX82_004093 [Trebouxia sp. C0006]